MKITRVQASGFLTFGKDGLALGDLPKAALIVGPNAAGKTNFFRAIQFVADVFTRKVTDAEHHHHNFNSNEDLTVRLGVKLTDREASDLADLVVTSSKFEVRFQSSTNIDTNDATSIAYRILDLYQPILTRLFRREIYYNVQRRPKVSQQLEYFVEIPVAGKSLFSTMNGFTTTQEFSYGFQPFNLGEALTWEFASGYPGTISLGAEKKPVSESQITEFASDLDLNWLLSAFTPKGALPVMLNFPAYDLAAFQLRQGADLTVLNRVKRSLASKGVTTGAVGLREFFGLILSSGTLRLADVRSAPSAQPLPPIESIPESFTPIDGSEIPTLLFRLKNGNDPTARGRFWALCQTFFDLTGYGLDVVMETYVKPRSLEERFSPSQPTLQIYGPSQTTKQPRVERRQSAGLRFSNDRVQVGSDFGAAGLLELVNVLYLCLGQTDSLILLDEPAQNLHPTKQKELLDTILQAARRQRNQLFVITHSAFFVRPDLLGQTYRFLYRSGETTVRRIASDDPAEKGKMMKYVERNPRLTSALFANRAFLVEGADEQASIPIWFQECAGRQDLDVLGVEYLEVNGNDGFKPFAEILDAWGVDYRLLGDRLAAGVLMKYGPRGATYPFDDFKYLLRRYARKELEAAKKTLRPSNGDKDPAVAAEVARNSDPPPPIRKLWRKFGKFALGIGG